VYLETICKYCARETIAETLANREAISPNRVEKYHSC
jgi:hypothetical protein